MDNIFNTYCEKYNHNKDELMSELALEDKSIPNWVTVSMKSSLYVNRDLLDEFMKSRFYKRIHSDIKYKLKRNENKIVRLPVDLNQFLYKAGTACPVCESLLVESEGKFICCNCNYDTNSLDNLSLRFEHLEEKELFGEEKELVEDMRFRYDTRLENSDDERGTIYTYIDILDPDSLEQIGCIEIHYKEDMSEYNIDITYGEK